MPPLVAIDWTALAIPPRLTGEPTWNKRRQAGQTPPAPRPKRSGEINRQGQETDGFQLVIDALKLNGIDTIFGLPGIPITDLTRRLQARRHCA